MINSVQQYELYKQTYFVRFHRPHINIFFIKNKLHCFCGTCEWQCNSAILVLMEYPNFASRVQIQRLFARSVRNVNIKIICKRYGKRGAKRSGRWFDRQSLFMKYKRQNIFRRQRESASSRHLLVRVVNILIPPINVQISMKESAARIFK